jgi:hypothetical protein
VLPRKITNPITVSVGPSISKPIYISRLLFHVENTKSRREQKYFFFSVSSSAQEFDISKFDTG